MIYRKKVRHTYELAMEIFIYLLAACMKTDPVAKQTPGQQGRLPRQTISGKKPSSLEAS